MTHEHLFVYRRRRGQLYSGPCLASSSERASESDGPPPSRDALAPWLRARLGPVALFSSQLVVSLKRKGRLERARCEPLYQRGAHEVIHQALPTSLRRLSCSLGDCWLAPHRAGKLSDRREQRRRSVAQGVPQRSHEATALRLAPRLARARHPPRPETILGRQRVPCRSRWQSHQRSTPLGTCHPAPVLARQVGDGTSQPQLLSLKAAAAAAARSWRRRKQG